MNNKAKHLVDEAIEELKQQLDQGKSEALIRYLECMSRFHRYSWCNVLLINRQNPGATHVAGFRKWKEMNRWVRKGESGIGILAPLRRRIEQEDEATGKDKRYIAGFRIVHVFDISQTEGEEFPELSQPVGNPGQSLQRLEQLISLSDIELAYEAIPGGAEGYSANGKIVIEESLAQTERFVTLVHELAHEWLGHHRRATTPRVHETEAEAVAYVVCRASGVLVPGSSDYIQLYQGNSTVLGESLGRIQQVSARILTGISQAPGERASK